MLLQIEMISQPSVYLGNSEIEIYLVTKFKISVAISYLLQGTLG